jgi:hypothetical protein
MMLYTFFTKNDVITLFISTEKKTIVMVFFSLETDLSNPMIKISIGSTKVYTCIKKKIVNDFNKQKTIHHLSLFFK